MNEIKEIYKLKKFKITKKVISYVLLCSNLIVLSACGGGNNVNVSSSKKSIALMTDTGGINDQAFNQSAWEGAQKVKEELDFDIRYIESKQVADYKTNLDALTDDEPDMIFVMGYTAADILKDFAEINKQQHYAIIDYKYDETTDNILSIEFRDEESAFLVGYIAGNTTKTNKIGFIGGAKSETIDAFEYGFRAGVEFAAKKLNKDIDVKVQYAENFQDDTKGKAMANVMYSNGIDVIFHSAGNLGRGVIEAAKENDKYVIGADRDQNYLAPKNVISSTLKLTGEVVYQTCKEINESDDLNQITGKNVAMGLAENAVGLAESTKEMISEQLWKEVQDLKNKIIDKTIVPPHNQETFDKYITRYKK